MLRERANASAKHSARAPDSNGKRAPGMHDETSSQRPPECCRDASLSSRLGSIATLQCLRDALAMLRRCKPLRARITLAHVRRWCRAAIDAGVVEHWPRRGVRVPGRVCKACRARTGVHVARVSKHAAARREWCRPRFGHRPQSLCPCGFSESAMTRGRAFRGGRAHAARRVIDTCGGV